MKLRKRRSIRLYLLLALTGLALLNFWPSLVAVMPLTAQHHLERAWRFAADVDRFTYRTNVVQTTRPTAGLENAGSTATTQRFFAEGQVDRLNKAMALTLRGHSAGVRGLELKVEGGQAYGRLKAGDPWTEIENPTDIFAPGGDPLGFLVAAENVQELTVNQEPSTSIDTFESALVNDAAVKRYAFDINPVRYAEYVRNQLEAALRDSGELPAGMSLDIVRQFVRMQGRGEIWVSESGLPIRQVIHLAFPPERNAASGHEADITTDFSDWEYAPGAGRGWFALPARLWTNPGQLISDPLSLFPTSPSLTPETLRLFGLLLGLSLLLAALTLIILTHRRSARLYMIVAPTMVALLLITPLLQVHNALAYTTYQQARQSELAQQRETRQTTQAGQNTLAGRNFNPLVNPLAAGDQEPAVSLPANPHTPHHTPHTLTPNFQTTCDLTDANADCDGDGLDNGVEQYKLGTDPEDIDSDDDNISDAREVKGFYDNGQQWYLNPLNSDSNGDGLADNVECEGLEDVEGDVFKTSFTASSCAYSDTDTTPDVFDFDNDGDGVPDSVDLDPNSYLGSLSSGLSGGNLNFNLTLSGAEEPIFVDFDLRPTNADHLWQSNNVYDWPTNDTQGQVTRVFTTTYGDLYGSDASSNMYNGDIKLVPLLEIEITYNAANPSAGLPITSTMTSADIHDYSDLSWLDTDALDELGISVNEGETSNTLLVWTPLNTIEDETGDKPVAWRGRMAYWPEAGQTSLGSNQQIRVIWLVQGLVDSCDTSGLTNTDDYDTFCADTSNWTTSTSVLQTYYDDVYLAGLAVREDHGAQVAVVAQPRGVGSSLYEDYLWQLADNLSEAYLRAQTNPATGARYAVSDINGSLSSWGISGLNVNSYTLDNQMDLADLSAITNTAILNSVFSGAGVGDTATLLYVGEETARLTGLNDDDTQASGNTVIPNLASVSLDTQATLRWSPFVYQGAGVWDSQELETYLTNLETNLETVFTQAELSTLVNGETIDDVSLARQGAAGMGQSYYLSLYVGLNGLLEVDGQSLGSGAVDNSALALSPGSQAVTNIISDMLDDVQDYYASLTNIGVSVIDTNVSAVSSLAAAFSTSRSDFLKSLGLSLNGEATSTLSLALQQMSGFYQVSEVDTTNLTSVGAFTALAAASTASSFTTGLGVTYGLLKVGSGAFSAKWGYALYKGADFVQDAISAGKTGWSLKAVKLWNNTKVWAVATFVASSALSLTFYFLGDYDNHLEQSAALARTVATIIVNLIMAVISAIPGIGFLITGIIGLMDGLAAAICAATGVKAGSDVDVWVCGGVSGMLTEVIRYLIFDQYILVDLQKEDRLSIALDTPTTVQVVDEEGVVSGNKVQVSATVTNTLSLNKPTGMGSGINYLLDLLGWADWKEVMRQSTFSYTLQTSPTDQHAGLSQNQLAWTDNTETFYPSTTASLLSPGLNRNLDVYLTESFNIPTIECWGFIIQKCSLISYKDSFHTYLGDDFVFDIFPASVDDLFKLTLVQDKSYRQSWDDQFGALQDADGDGLRSQAFGGPDLNDSDADSDGDGLSDYWELDNGFDPESLDGDNDGLYDYWEAFYGTNPYLADSDGDGLTDGQEFFHSNSRSAAEADNSTWSGGWAIVYDYDSSGQAQQTWVSADPLDYDSDDDTLLDKQEFIYGYNPNLTSVLNILSLNSESSSSVVAPGASLAYTATIKNELDNRVANGLLQAEFPVDTVQTTQVIGSLYPQMETTLTGAVTAPSVAQTQAASLTLRAGAVIDTSAVNQIFVLNLAEAAGATTFYDATSNRYDFTGYGNPVANSGYVEFDGNEALRNYAGDSFSQRALSAEIWVKPASTPQSGATLFDISGQFQVQLSSSYRISVKVNNVSYLTGSTALTPNEWNHVMVTYDLDSGQLVSYVNGRPDASAAGVPAVSWSANPGYRFALGSLFNGAIDYAALHNYALSAAEVAEEFSNSLTFYATFDQAGCGNYVDSISYQKINCGYYSSSSYQPISDNGLVQDGLRFVTTSGYGSQGYVQVDGSVPLAGSDNAFSLGVWLKKLADGGSFSKKYYLFNVDGAGGDDLTLYANWGSDLTLSLGNCVNGITLAETDYLPDWGWHHLGLTYDGRGTLRVYGDGEEMTSQTCIGLPNLQTVSTLRLGAPYNNPSALAFRGQVDELRFYSKALSADQMAVLVDESARSLNLAFDEPPGQTRFADTSPNSFAGSCAGANCPDSGLAGRDNQAIRLNGTSHYVTLETADVLGLTQSNFTVMAWVKGEAFSGAKTILGTDSAPSVSLNGLQLAVKDTQPYMSFYGSGNDLTGNTSLSAGQWYHLAWRYEYESDDVPVKKMTLFVNGVEDSSATNRDAFSGTGVVSVGRSWQSSYFDGLLDNLVIVKEALSQDEIQAIMNEAPAANLHLDEDLNTTTFTDDSPGQYHATCSGTACPAVGAKGQIREAPVFAGDDSLSLPAVSDLSADNFSLGLWVKPTQTKNSPQYLLRNGDNFGLSLEANGSGLEFYVKNGSASCNTKSYYATNAELIEDQWNHLFVTAEFDDTTGFTYNFYLNGTKTNRVVSNAYVNCGDPTPAAIGETFEGSLDELTLYDAVLNGEEVEAIYAYQSAWYDVTEQHLVTIDADNPLVSLDLPDFLANKATWLTISAVDPGSTIAQVQVTVTPPGGGSYSGWAVRSESGSGNNGAWLYAFTPSGAGQYTLAAVATDAVNHTASAVGTFSIDDTLPSGSLDAGLTSTLLRSDSSQKLSLYGAVTDSGSLASGVATNTLSVALYDHTGAAVEGAQYAAGTEDSWQVDYPFSSPAYGQYEVRLDLQDQVTNAYSDTIGLISVDDYAPVMDTSLTTAVISTPQTMGGIASDVPYPQEGRVLNLHFEEEAGATEFADSSGNLFTATCALTPETCPTAGETDSGQQYSRGLIFDGSNDSLSFDSDPLFDLSEGTLMAWIRPTWASGANGYDPVILSLSDGVNTAYRWQIGDDYQHMSLFNGAETQSVPVSLTPNEWHHLALTLADGQWTGYVDGVASGVMTQTFGSTTGLPLHLGSASGGDNLFSGALDEVVIYDQALSAEVIYDLAQPLSTGVALAQVRYRHLQDGEQSETEGTWYKDDDGVELDFRYNNFSRWYHVVPDTLEEGPYKIDLKATDQLGNEAYIPNAWSGEIDLSPPQLTLTYKVITDGFARVSCEAHDFTITATHWSCPASGLTYGDEDAAWFTGFFSPLTRTTYLSTSLQTLASPANTLTACDEYEHCATTVATDTTPLAEVSAILTPTTDVTFTGYAPIEISGIVRSPGQIRSLDVTANGQSVYTATWTTDLTETTWSTFWTPSTYGNYTLEANLTNGLGQTIVDESEVTLTVLYPDVSIAKRVTPSALLRAGDPLTYTLTLTNSGNADAAEVLITDTLPAGVSGSNFSRSADIPAGESITYTIAGTVIGTDSIITNTAFFSHSSGSSQAEVAFDRCDYMIVTNANDSGPGSLRQALSDACDGSLITFAGSYTIYLTSTLSLTKDLTVDGTGYTITVSGDSGGNGSGNVQVFNITAGSDVTLSHLNIVNGKTTLQYGGGIYNAGALTLQDSTLANNQASYTSYNSGKSQGGGIYNTGALTVTNSLLEGNQATNGMFLDRRGGAIYHEGTSLLVSGSIISGSSAVLGGGIYIAAKRTATLNNVTMLNNVSVWKGGGIFNASGGSVTLTNSTLAANKTPSYIGGGAGIYNEAALVVNNNTFSANSSFGSGAGILNSSPGTLVIRNTILANSLQNDGGSVADCATYTGGTVQVANSLIEWDDGCGALLTGDPLLADLGDYGGPSIGSESSGQGTLTFALLPGSPAINAGSDSACETTDQRGAARFGTCDLGAFESQGYNLTYGGGSAQSTVIDTVFGQPLTLTVTANVITEPVAGGQVSYAGPTSGAGLSATVTAAIGSDGVGSAVITANNVAGSYGVTATAQGSSSPALYTMTNLCGTTLYTVTNAADDGVGSLRRGLNNTCAGGSIVFSGDTTITLNSPLAIAQDVSIDGSGHTVTIDGNDTGRLFEIAPAVEAQLNHLNLVNGSGVLNQGRLILTNSSLRDHNAAALQNEGQAWITHTTFSANSSHISSTLSLTLTNTTLDNSSGDGLVNTGTAMMNNVTLANSSGRGLVNTGTAAISNSLIAGSGGADCLNSGVLAANTHNLIEDGTCSPALSGSPRLSSLGNYGSDTPTLGLLSGSPALDAGDDASCETTDQRGEARFGSCDIGAFESHGFSLSYVSGSDQRANVNTPFPNPLRVQITATNTTEPVGAGGLISYTSPISGAGLSAAEVTATTNASGLASLSATSNDTFGAYVISATTIGASEVVTFSLENYDCSIPQVSNANDSGLGSLRQALIDACDGAVITFNDDFTITLQSTLSTRRQLTIDGSGHNIILNGDKNGNGLHDQYDDARPLLIQSGGQVTLTHLSIISGSDQASTGGGAILNYGKLWVYNVLFRDNYAYSGGDPGGGGAIFNAGTLGVQNSVFLNNTADRQGGALINQGNATLANSTFSGNHAADLAGAIYHDSGQLELFNSTLVSNSGLVYSGLYVAANGGYLDLRNTLFDDNDPLSLDCYNPAYLRSTSAGNLSPGSTFNCAVSAVSDLGLGPLADYDSTDWPDLPAYPLLLTSPALDAGDSTTCAGDAVAGVDQRGESRLAGNGCDIGAFEAQFTLTAVSGDNQSTASGTAFAQPLEVAISSRNGEPLGSGGVITYSGSGLAAAYPAMLNAGGTASATVTANLLPGSYRVTATGAGVISPALFSLTNLNFAPVVTSAVFTVNEDAPVGTLVGVVEAGDPNGTALDYTFSAGNTNNAFAIGASGQISVANTLDYETRPQYLLTVMVSDGSLTGTAAITLNLTNRLADLALTQSVDPTTSVAGQFLTYTLVFSNAGFETVTNPVLRDILPPEFSPLKLEMTLDDGVSLSRTPDTTYEWTINSLAPGQGGVITIIGIVSETLDLATITNTATLSSTEEESDLTNNQATALAYNCGASTSVSNANDDGDDSLRWAIANTCDGGQITFTDDFTITLGSSLEVNKTLTINSSGQTVTLNGGEAVQIFYLGSSGALTLSHLSLVNGNDPLRGGGAAYVAEHGSLTVLDSSFNGNSSHQSGGAIFVAPNGSLLVQNSFFSDNSSDWGGGAIQGDENSSLTILDSSFSRNSCNWSGGAIGSGGNTSLTVDRSAFNNNTARGDGYTGGAIAGEGVLTVTASIFSGNTATSGGAIAPAGPSGRISGSTFSDNRVNEGDGGAIVVNADTLLVENSTFYSNTATASLPDLGQGGAISNWGATTINNSTFVNNTATKGSAIYNSSEGSGEMSLSNSLIAGSSSALQCEGTLSSNLNNLIEDGSCSLIPTGDLLIASLDDYGGETPTIALLPGSPAIDAGDEAACAAADQRGEARLGICDIGAFESQGFSLTYSSGDNQSVLINTPFAQPLALTVTANVITEPLTGGVVNFYAPISGAGLTTTSFSLTLPANGVVSTSVSANNQPGSYGVTATTAGATTAAVTFNLTNTTPANDLILTKTVTPPTALPGEIITYTLAFANGGSAVAPGVVITDSLPISLSVQSVIISGTGTMTHTSSPAFEVFELSELAIGQSGLITLTAVLSGNLPAITVVTNSAAISSSAADGNPANNSAAIGLTVGNATPLLALSGDQTITESLELTLTLAASDLNGDPLTFGLNQAPAGAAISSGGLFTWTPTESQGPGVFTVTVVVSDSYGLSDSQSFRVMVSEAQSAPVFSFSRSHSLTETHLLTFTLAAADADVPAQSLSFGLLDTPVGASLDNVTGVFTWTPGEMQGGSSYTLTALVTDTTGLTGSQALVIAVVKENSNPILTPITPALTIIEGTTLAFTASAADSDLPTQALTFTLQTFPFLKAPTGATLDPATGLFTWTPTEIQGPGVYYVVVVASDQEGASDGQLLIITVLEENFAPVLDPLTSTYIITESETLTFTATATDSDLQTLAFSFLDDAPEGVMVSRSSGLFSWTPDETQGPGVYSVTLIVSDGSLTDRQTLIIFVNEENSSPVLAAVADQTIQAASPLTFTLAATDADEPANTLSYSLSNGPAGASLDAVTGLFSWTPSDTQAASVYTLTFTVSDNGAPVLTDTTDIVITVTAKEVSPIYLPLIIR